MIGSGSTGTVFEARCESDETHDDRSMRYAIKMAMHGSSQKDMDRVARLQSEFKIYLAIESRRRTWNVRGKTPRCYGLFTSKYASVLVMSFEGTSLDGDWSQLTKDDW